MVNKNDQKPVQDDSEITYDATDTTDSELVDDEITAEQKIKKLRNKLEELTDKNRELQEEVQRTKADFLNARRRLEEDQQNDRRRSIIKAVETLLPLADSFYLAMLDKAAWEKGDEKWRKGVEGIKNQLDGILRSYGTKSFSPENEQFDPNRHDAMSMVSVSDQALHHRVLSVMQLGYEIADGETSMIVRPARVTVGEYNK